MKSSEGGTPESPPTKAYEFPDVMQLKVARLHQLANVTPMNRDGVGPSTAIDLREILECR